MRAGILSFLCLLSIAGSARGEVTNLAFGEVEAAPGEIVRVPVFVSLTAPVRLFSIAFRYEPARLEYLAYEVGDTDLRGASPLNVIHNSLEPGGGIAAYQGVRNDTREFRVPPGDRILGELVFRVLASAEVGASALTPVPSIGPLRTLFDEEGVSHEPLAVEPGSVTVLAPSGPRPVASLACVQAVDRIELSFAPTGVYDAIELRRDASLLASLPGDASSYEDLELVLGEREYTVTAFVGAVASVAVSCQISVLPAAAPPVQDLSCSPTGLSWVNPIAYDSFVVRRDGEEIATLPGTETSLPLADASPDLVVYTVVARVRGHESPEATCFLNPIWQLEIGDVSIDEGTPEFRIPIYATTSARTRGFDMQIEVDSEVFELVRDLDGALEGTVGWSEPEFFQIGMHGGLLLPSAGVQFDFFPPREREKDLLVGVRQHVFSWTFRARRPLVAGEVFRVTRAFGSIVVHQSGHACDCTTLSVNRVPILLGEIRVGASGPAPVAGLAAGRGGALAGEAGGERGGQFVALRWEPRGRYDALRIERNGERIATLPGDARSYLDADVPAGVFTYKVIAVVGESTSRPTVAVVSTVVGRGTFLRGDANLDGEVDLTDSIRTLEFLFRGATSIPCADGADADDDGQITLRDPLLALTHLFGGIASLPAPTGGVPWFDPSDDTLDCGE